MSFVFVIAMNVFFLLYVFLFTISHHSVHQAAFFQSFVGWLAIEIVVVSTLFMCISRILLPLLTFLEVINARKIIEKAISDFIIIDDLIYVKQEFNIFEQFMPVAPVIEKPPFFVIKCLSFSFCVASCSKILSGVN